MNQESYAVLGSLIITNLGAIIAFIKSLLSKEAQLTKIETILAQIQIDVASLKESKDKQTNDLNQAHQKIRDLQWQLKSTDV